MRLLSKSHLKYIWRIAAAAGLAMCVTGALTGTAAASSGNSGNNLLMNVAYYTVNNGTVFCRYATPPASVDVTGGGFASQSRNPAGNGPVRLAISNAGGYADNGFYVLLGTLGDLTGYTASGTGDSFATNLWLDTNTTNDTATNGDFFTWNATGECLEDLGGDISGLGPQSVPTGHHEALTVNGSSTFNLTCNDVYQPVTLAELKAGGCAGIGPQTQVATWIGITAPTGGFLNTKITSVTRTR